MGTIPPTAKLLRTCSKCKEPIPVDKGAVHCTRIPCAGAIYHYECWVKHPCMVKE